MTTRDDLPDPLPREWLPESPVPPEEDAEYWEGRVRTLMAEATPALAAHRTASPRSVSWLDALGARWRMATAGAFALAASAVAALVLSGEHRGAPDPRAMVLGAVVGKGEPAALWEGAGVAADPTLAILALENAAQRTGGER